MSEAVERICKLDRSPCKFGIAPFERDVVDCDTLKAWELRKKVGLTVAPYDCPRALAWWFSQPEHSGVKAVSRKDEI